MAREGCVLSVVTFDGSDWRIVKGGCYTGFALWLSGLIWLLFVLTR